MGLFLASPVRCSWLVVHSIKGVSIILVVFEMGLFVIFLVHRLHRLTLIFTDFLTANKLIDTNFYHRGHRGH